MTPKYQLLSGEQATAPVPHGYLAEVLRAATLEGWCLDPDNEDDWAYMAADGMTPAEAADLDRCLAAAETSWRAKAWLPWKCKYIRQVRALAGSATNRIRIHH